MLGLPEGRRVWLKDYGWSPVGSFKVMGALNWMHRHREQIGDRPVVAHSSGNFASGLAYAGMRYGKRVILVMPDTAPQVKANLTRSFGAEIRTYDIANDHLTGIRDAMVQQILRDEQGYAAHPYDDPDVIAGNGVGGLEIVDSLIANGRSLSHFYCAISGGGLMSGHAVAIHHAFLRAAIIGVEPAGANDFQLSFAAGNRQRLEKPTSICDGLLSYDVGVHNWPILSQMCTHSVIATDTETQRAMSWLYQNHGLRSEPSGAITLAALMNQSADALAGTGDIVVVISGRNVDESLFATSLKAQV
jgi:threonine dehydratase